MFKMIPGMNPRKMQQAMKRMGISQIEVPATEVIIKSENKEIIISNPNVSKVNMMGQETYQITGDAQERELKVEIDEEDVNTVVEQAKVSKEEAKKALQENNGDIAATIISLQNL